MKANYFFKTSEMENKKANFISYSIILTPCLKWGGGGDGGGGGEPDPQNPLEWGVGKLVTEGLVSYPSDCLQIKLLLSFLFHPYLVFRIYISKQGIHR